MTTKNNIISTLNEMLDSNKSDEFKLISGEFKQLAKLKQTLFQRASKIKDKKKKEKLFDAADKISDVTALLQEL